MWKIATFQSTSLFSLRPANATTSGGKSLLTPTPFSIKMALLDVVFRHYGTTTATQYFPELRDLQVAIALPSHINVINTFIKILRPHKAGVKDTFGTGLAGPMGNTISYRELVYFPGDIKIAVRPSKNHSKIPYAQVLTNLHYLGKRGGFMQCRHYEEGETLAPTFTLITPHDTTSFHMAGTMQLLDDCGGKMTLAHADVFNNKSVGINKPNGRFLHPIILPYRITRSSRSYTLYEKLPPQT